MSGSPQMEQIWDRTTSTHVPVPLQGFLEVWGEGSTFEELCAAIRAFPEHRKQRWSHPHLSFKIVVDGWGRSISQQEQLELIDQLAFLNMAVRTCQPQRSGLGSDLPIFLACFEELTDWAAELQPCSTLPSAAAL